MIYKDFKGKKLSALGMGCMRLPVLDGEGSPIDEIRTAEMIDFAMKNGINYYDTAWGYHEGNSELVMGKILHNYPRDSFYLATKFPGYSVSNMDKAEEIFEDQLRKCQVDHFDFYLLHCLCDTNINAYLDKEKYGVVEYFISQKKAGRIGYLGFSTHASLEDLRRFLEVYAKEMEFCQVQLNYLDWTQQKAKEQVEMLREYNIPVWVMEPVRGGKLAKLEDTYAKMLAEHRPDETHPGWAFRFIQSIPDVVVTLSGMSDYEQTKANIKTFSEELPLNKQEWHTVMKIADMMQEKKAVPCTACRYCTSYCPQNLDIPHLIELYNDYCFSNGENSAAEEISATDTAKRPSACIGCKSCEEVCPQKIKISDVMSDFAARL